jgi:hypothetical protein
MKAAGVRHGGLQRLRNSARRLKAGSGSRKNQSTQPGRSQPFALSLDSISFEYSCAVILEFVAGLAKNCPKRYSLYRARNSLQVTI